MSSSIPIFGEEGVVRLSNHLENKMNQGFGLSEMEKRIVKTTVDCMFVSVGRYNENQS